MNLDVIPDNVKQLIAQHIHSVIGLELLLRIQAEPAQDWSARKLAAELRVSLACVQRELVDLTRRGFVSSSEGARFRYSPRSDELSDTVARLAVAYRERRVRIIQLIYSAPNEPMQSFADAFRLRREPVDG